MKKIASLSNFNIFHTVGGSIERAIHIGMLVGTNPARLKHRFIGCLVS